MSLTYNGEGMPRRQLNSAKARQLPMKLKVWARAIRGIRRDDSAMGLRATQLLISRYGSHHLQWAVRQIIEKASGKEFDDAMNAYVTGVSSINPVERKRKFAYLARRMDAALRDLKELMLYFARQTQSLETISSPDADTVRHFFPYKLGAIRRKILSSKLRFQAEAEKMTSSPP